MEPNIRSLKSRATTGTTGDTTSNTPPTFFFDGVWMLDLLTYHINAVAPSDSSMVAE